MNIPLQNVLHFRLIHQWDIVTGRIRRIFHHPNNQKFLQCSVDDQMEYLAAVDEDGSCYVWKLREKEVSTLGQTRLRRRTTSKLKPGSAVQMQTAAEAPDPTHQLEKHIQVDSMSDYQSIQMLLDKTNMVVAMKNNSLAYCTNITDRDQAEEITGIHGPFKFALKVNKDALLVSDTKCAIICIAKQSVESVINLKEILGSNADHLSDVAYASAVDLALFAVGDRLVFWNPTMGNKEKSFSVQLTGMNAASAKAILPTTITSCIVVDKDAKQYCRIDLNTRAMIDIREMSKKNQPVQHATVTPDGQYLLYACNDKDLCLLRLSDGKLLAWYTMYDTVQSLSVSTNSWYALIGTSDRRLFVLVIADPLERSHDKRIEHVRKANPPLTQEQMVTLMGDVNSFDFDSDQSYVDSSDDEYLVEKATKRLQQRKDDALGRKLVILYSSDSSEEDEEEHMMVKHRPKSKGSGKLLHKENSTVSAPSTAYDGELFTASPCSLQ